MLNFILAVIFKRRKYSGTSMAVQWLRLCVPIAGTTGSIPGQAKKIPQCSEKKKKRRRKYSMLISKNSKLTWTQRYAKNLYSNLKADPEVLGFPHQTWHFNFPTKSSVTLKGKILFSPYIICIKPIRRAREIRTGSPLLNQKQAKSVHKNLLLSFPLVLGKLLGSISLTEQNTYFSGKSVHFFPSLPVSPRCFEEAGMMLPQHSILTPITRLCKYLFPLPSPWLHHRLQEDISYFSLIHPHTSSFHRSLHDT